MSILSAAKKSSGEVGIGWIKSDGFDGVTQHIYVCAGYGKREIRITLLRAWGESRRNLGVT